MEIILCFVYNLILQGDTDRSKRSREEGGLQNYEIDYI